MESGKGFFRGSCVVCLCFCFGKECFFVRQEWIFMDFFVIVEGAGPDWLAFFCFREKQCRFCLISIY